MSEVQSVALGGKMAEALGRIKRSLKANCPGAIIKAVYYGEGDSGSLSEIEIIQADGKRISRDLTGVAAPDWVRLEDILDVVASENGEGYEIDDGGELQITIDPDSDEISVHIGHFARTLDWGTPFKVAVEIDE